MTKEQLIHILKYNLELIQNTDLPDNFKMYHTIDKGGFVDDSYEINEFDLDFSYDKEDNVLYLNYFGDEG